MVIQVTRTARRWPRYVVLLAATAAELAILGAPKHSVGATLLVLLAAGASGVLVYVEHRRPVLRLGPTAAAICLVVLVATILPPRTSKDVWSYTMYGRAVTVH